MTRAVYGVAIALLCTMPLVGQYFPPISGGTVTSVGLAGTPSQITVTGPSPITGAGSWTLSFPARGVTLPGTTIGAFKGPLTGNVTGTATALAATPTKCSAGNYPLGVDASGNAQNCTTAPTSVTTNQNIRSIQFSFDGGGSALSGTMTRCTQVNFAGTIQQVTLLADVSGTVTVDIQTVAYASYTGPAAASSIAAAAVPALSSAAKYQDATLTGWTTSLVANTVVCFALSNPATVSWVSGNLKVAAN